MALKCVLFQHILADMSLPLTLSLSFSLSYTYKHHTKAISRILSIFRSGFSFFEPHHLTLSLFLFPSVFHLNIIFSNKSLFCLHNAIAQWLMALMPRFGPSRTPHQSK